MGEKGHRFGTETLRTGAEELTHEAQVLTHGVMTAPFRLRTYRLIRKILIGFILVSIANVLFSVLLLHAQDVPHPARQPRDW